MARFRSNSRASSSAQPQAKFFFRQIWTLCIKNFMVIFVRHWFWTSFRAFFLPCAYIIFLAYAKNLFVPPANYGIGSPSPAFTLSSALSFVSGERDKLIFVNSGFADGQIAQVIQDVTYQAGSMARTVQVLQNESDLNTVCKSSIRGTSKCIGAIVFYSSPTEGLGAKWNYSIRADGGLGGSIYVERNDNDAQIYIIPLQHAVDEAIARTRTGSTLPSVDQYAYTTVSAEQRAINIRTNYMGAIINIIAVTFYIGMICITYQQVGLIATERELGMAQLLDAMMPNRKRWQPQWVRTLASHVAFDIMFSPSWIVMAGIICAGVFPRTNAAVVIFTHIFSGLALSSFNIFGGAFFKKAQLSGISATIIYLLLGIIAQVTGKPRTPVAAILSLIFPPMNYVYTIIYIAYWEQIDSGAKIFSAAPASRSRFPLIGYWAFAWIQMIVYPWLAAYLERALHGTASKSRTTQISDDHSSIEITNFTREYKLSFFKRLTRRMIGKKPKSVIAVNDLSLTAVKGEIMVLLGANGSGKSTTLDAIAGLNTITSGSMSINYPEEGTGLGLCPQKNVLWDDLTVEEHVRIFNKIKSLTPATKEENWDLIQKCDIALKGHAKSKTLSGGQKRKAQLAIMFTGGSRICCVDEVSSGLDPISRRKIWDILLAERGHRSIILTTHFLDEADLLADHIAILSKGVLKCTGTSVELKHTLGSGYRVHVFHQTQGDNVPQVYTAERHVKQDDRTIYLLTDASSTSSFLSKLERDGITEYQVSGPTIEDVFLKVADEVATEKFSAGTDRGDGDLSSDSDVMVAAQTEVPQLLSGTRISIPKQALTLFGKRFVILRRNSFPYVAAFMIPILATGLCSLFLKSFTPTDCSTFGAFVSIPQASFNSINNYRLVVGPRSSLSLSSLQVLTTAYNRNSTGGTNSTGGGSGGTNNVNTTALVNSITLVDTLNEFEDFISTRYMNVTPGGFFLGNSTTPPTYAWRGNRVMAYAAVVQNIMDILLTNIPIAVSYQPFDIGGGVDVGESLQLITYFALAFSIYPALFGLYPTVERIRQVRGMHYSNGVRPAPLWLAYIAFDFIIVLVSSVIVVVIFRAATTAWWNLGYMFIVLFMYGLASIVLSYVVSLFSRSQLSTFAFAAGGQAVWFLLYYVAFMCALTYSGIDNIDRNVNLCNFILGLILPIGNLMRGMFLALNVFEVSCNGQAFKSYPGEMTAYGGPILYLALQTVFYFGILLWWDSGPLFSLFRSKNRHLDNEEEVDEKYINQNEDIEGDTVEELASAKDGLQVVHLSKQFKKNLAVDNITFGVPRGEVFALLGPNGAGKSSTISLIRGDIKPSVRGGEILVDNVSVIRHRAKARSRLGVCPQFDAMDTMTVSEHLYFYARIRGIASPKHNVEAVIRAVGLDLFKDRMAGKLSGGNKRKLSLGIALMGNPTVLLLDEPSSGMDAASKRVMWRTLASTVPGRSLVLTTHSMEEADALATRAGIMAGRMLALGTTDWLRREHGNSYYVHVVHKDAPHTKPEEMRSIRDWVVKHFPDASIEDKIYAGQMRFSVPVATADKNLSKQIRKESLGSTRRRSTKATIAEIRAQEREEEVQKAREQMMHDLNAYSNFTLPSNVIKIKSPSYSEDVHGSGSGLGSEPVSGHSIQSDIQTPHGEATETGVGVGGDSILLSRNSSVNKSISVTDDMPRQSSIKPIATTVGNTTIVTAKTTDKSATATSSGAVTTSTISPLFSALEQNQARLDILYYSVSRATLDQVFLNIVGKHNVAEEGERDAATNEKKKHKWFGLGRTDKKGKNGTDDMTSGKNGVLAQSSNEYDSNRDGIHADPKIVGEEALKHREKDQAVEVGIEKKTG